MDNLTPQQRREIMKAIRGKNKKPKMIARRESAIGTGE